MGAGREGRRQRRQAHHLSIDHHLGAAWERLQDGHAHPRRGDRFQPVGAAGRANRQHDRDDRRLGQPAHDRRADGIERLGPLDFSQLPDQREGPRHGAGALLLFLDWLERLGRVERFTRFSGRQRFERGHGGRPELPRLLDIRGGNLLDRHGGRRRGRGRRHRHRFGHWLRRRDLRRLHRTGTGAGGGERLYHFERRRADGNHWRPIVPALAAIAHPRDGRAAAATRWARRLSAAARAASATAAAAPATASRTGPR